MKLRASAWFLSAVLGVSASIGSVANAQSDFDFTGVDAQLAGEPTRALVLGSPHIAQMPKEAVQIEHLALVLDRLEDFAPDVVTVEALDGLSCERLRRYEKLYPRVANRYCSDPKVALEALSMTSPEARFAAFEALDALGDTPSTQQRRRLALLFLGAGERWSAALQWSYLAPEERVAGDGVSDDLVETLGKLLASRNESNLIGVEIARRRSLNRVVAMDDHTADFVLARAPETLWPTVQAMWGRISDEAKAMQAKQMEFLGSSEGVLAGYRFLNAPEAQQITIDADFGAAARNPENETVSRQYLAWWQTRGLRMAANVVEAAGNQPGAKVLVVVGASHKSYFDAYLDQMQDFEIVDVDAVLTD
ncbi:MAG: DUF5694 domain-containing protein [Pseudomonadota bacterium]